MSTGADERADLRSGRIANLDRTIAHLDLDAFFVSVELQRRPELRGLPVIVSGTGPRSVVTTASYEARKFGVGSAMPTAKALRLCPEAVVVPPDGPAYKRMSATVMDLIRHHVPQVEQAGLDEAYADLTGMLAPSAAMRRVVHDIRTETGLHASVGIGPNRLVAKVASDAEKPDGFVFLSQEQARMRFADASTRLLPGVGPKTRERLERLQIYTVDDLSEASVQALTDEFGSRQGPWLRSRARFEDDTPVQTDREAVSESRETTFSVDVEGIGELREKMAPLVLELCNALETHGHSGRTVGIKIRYSDFETHTRARTLEHSVSDRETVGRIASQLLEEFQPNRPVRLLGVRVAGFSGAKAKPREQLSLPFG